MVTTLSKPRNLPSSVMISLVKLVPRSVSKRRMGLNSKIKLCNNTCAVSSAVVETSGMSSINLLKRHVITSKNEKPSVVGHGPATSAATTSVLPQAWYCCKGECV